ncbi:MAG: cold-shock protein [Egicoccus sp.]
MEADRITGEVRWYNDEKGYGFIAPDDDGDDVFVRYSSIAGDGFRSLDEGQRVAFDRSDDGRGPRALRVRPT